MHRTTHATRDREQLAMFERADDPKRLGYGAPFEVRCANPAPITGSGRWVDQAYAPRLCSFHHAARGVVAPWRSMLGGVAAPLSSSTKICSSSEMASFEVRGARVKAPRQSSRAGSSRGSTSQNASMRFHLGTGGVEPSRGT